jgi:hypothetical protein
MRLSILVMSVVVLVGCTQMKRDWEAQQQANANAQAAAQPANMETLCTSVKNAYCPRCGANQQQCGQVYVDCLGKNSPADQSAFNMGQVDQCGQDVAAGDCNVMPRVWPASCMAQTAQTTTCTGGAMYDTAQAQCVCTGGATWDGAQCVCAAGTGWNGSQCVALQNQGTGTGY